MVAKDENGNISLTPDGKNYRLYFLKNIGCRNLGGIRERGEKDERGNSGRA